MTTVRSALFAAWFFGLTTIMVFGALPLKLAPQRYAVWYARSWSRLVIAGLRVICGITWEVTGLEHLASGPALIAPMHQSTIDPLIWSVLVPRFTFVVKRELTRIPLFGTMLTLSGMIPVDRSAGAAAMRGLLRAAEKTIAAGRQIIIFPEGTRVAPGAQIRLQPGIVALVARTGLPIIPVATDSGLRWGRHAFRKQPGVIHLRIFPPIPADLKRQELLARLEAAFAEGAVAPAPPVDNSVGRPITLLRSRAS